MARPLFDFGLDYALVPEPPATPFVVLRCRCLYGYDGTGVAPGCWPLAVCAAHAERLSLGPSERDYLVAVLERLAPDDDDPLGAAREILLARLRRFWH